MLSNCSYLILNQGICVEVCVSSIDFYLFALLFGWDSMRVLLRIYNMYADAQSKLISCRDAQQLMHVFEYEQSKKLMD
jgi:hypothetical protein